MNAARTASSGNCGIVSTTSASAVITESIQPPAYAASAPKVTAMIVVSCAASEADDQDAPPAVDDLDQDVAPRVVGAEGWARRSGPGR